MMIEHSKANMIHRTSRNLGVSLVQMFLIEEEYLVNKCEKKSLISCFTFPHGLHINMNTRIRNWLVA